ncbi:MAG: hypothetical protein Q4E67_01085 [Planctomycetia bacterium]|nr:hypothetical protein [Planctomycetia bacterium]
MNRRSFVKSAAVLCGCATTEMISSPTAEGESKKLGEITMFEKKVDVNFYIDHATKENATGDIAKIYQMFPLMIPGPILIKSIDAQLAGMNANEIFYFVRHKTISSKVFSAIRYILAVRVNSAYCTAVNGKALLSGGLSEDMLDSLVKKESCKFFTDKENALIRFAVNASMNFETTNAEDINKVKSFGWNDEELLAAVVNGIDSIAGINVFKAFSVKEH